MLTMKNLRNLVFVISATVSMGALANHQGFYLGKVSLSDRQDTDVLHLPPCQAPGNKAVSFLQLEVRQFNADIDDLDVTYYNGDRQDISIRENFAPGSSSRWINLAGDKRCIKKIVLKGDTDTFGGHPLKQAQILFYGK